MKKLFFLAGLILFSLLWPALAAENDSPPAPQSGPDKQYGSVEERRIMESLQAGGAPFAREREDLENKKKELKRLEGEVDKKIEQLNQLRVRIEKLLEQKDVEEQKRIGELAKMYEKMTADKAAAALATVDQDLAISILGRMKTKSAAKVLNNLDRDKAAKLTTAFSITDTR
ncbi:magnesium transporter MgtE N-terminal domain-containing protein [Desulfobulbus sp.]|uniref:MotE family protein n=1 Tax=Desulfobulbus sp. TaxID=895 RepID=UPI00286F5B65|nr:hypothetical protein [Desulfobulbus sp.]